MFPNHILVSIKHLYIECYVVRFVSMNGYQKDVFEEIGLCAQNMRAFLSLVIDIFGVEVEWGRGPI